MLCNTTAPLEIGQATLCTGHMLCNTTPPLKIGQATHCTGHDLKYYTSFKLVKQLIAQDMLYNATIPINVS